ncbi:Utp21 specific WD40 associated domain protein (macronuclear) [Tetrahymena thermophila SB210]|uniref:Utp21 specific WD40 associated domain protein n=1 Tax=Tetrahymena thermophila (strain SB210) TaxID=312017 RepID=I7LY15_TETTS|nr:Utp21 specific WD40 associated domain protein [Tetrahymena thermophila SB210]EAS07174.2 Utp21 specific WD40 associated domain protein [Tetrahymena thermophila SB210]|eukprot:XP_001027416.2 Utp21 specific WD40 associated domain protein [Tetrahymena thermophila SB210]
MDLTDKLVLRPYKSLGVFCDSNQQFLYNAGNKLYLASTCGHSFKTYTIPEMKISLFGPHFEGKLRAIQGFNEFLFVAVKNVVYKMRHYHILGEMKMDAKITTMLLMADQIAIVDQNNTLKIFNHHSKICVATAQFDFNVQSIIHPPTYLNKILIIGENNVELWNINSMKKIYDYQNVLIKNYCDDNTILTVAEPSPVLNVIAFAFSNGKIVLHDIKKDKTVVSFKINHKPLSLSFSKVDQPLLAIGDEKGSIVIWDLNEKKIFASLKSVFQGSVTSINFMPNEQVFIAASGRDNAVLQFRYEEYEENKFAVLRRREGVIDSLKQVRFANDLHIFGCTSNQESEIRDFSMINECMSVTFSSKDQSKTKLKRKHIYTEQNAASTINEILEFSFSMNRANDWANVLTCHKESDKPCIWSSEDHSIIKKDLVLYENSKSKEQNFQITTVYVTKCGNFGVLGLDNGRVIKINMQSGAFQRAFADEHEGSITSIFVNNYNKYLITADNNGKMVIWDFFAGTKLSEKQYENEKIVFIRGSNYSHHFLVALTDNTIEMWDMLSLKRGRKFGGHTQKILDACFSHNNKYIFSSSLDSTLKVYDIAQNDIIANLEVERPIISLDNSPSGEFLITVFANSREINIWHNLVEILPWASPLKKTVKFVSPIKHTDIEDRKRYYLNNSIKQEEDELEEQMLLEGKVDYKIDPVNNSLNIIRFTQLEDGKWLPLIHLDEIKERNRLENNEEIDFKMPFFLDFSKKDEVRDQLKKEYQQKVSEQSKIIKDKKEKYMNELGSTIQKLVFDFKEKNYNKFFDELKSLTPSQADYELRQVLFGNTDNSIMRVLTFFNHLFDSTDELDLKNAYFSRVIKISGDELMRDTQYKEVIEQIRNKIQNSWQALMDKQYIISSMAEHFARIPN